VDRSTWYVLKNAVESYLVATSARAYAEHAMLLVDNTQGVHRAAENNFLVVTSVPRAATQIVFVLPVSKHVSMSAVMAQESGLVSSCSNHV